MVKICKVLDLGFNLSKNIPSTVSKMLKTCEIPLQIQNCNVYVIDFLNFHIVLHLFLEQKKRQTKLKMMLLKEKDRIQNPIMIDKDMKNR